MRERFIRHKISRAKRASIRKKTIRKREKNKLAPRVCEFPETRVRILDFQPSRLTLGKRLS